MAVLHAATLTPTKAELVATWLPRQDWYDGPVPPSPHPVASFRLDDPDGEVGIEFVIVRASPDDERLWHVPMTYRGAALAGGEDGLIGVMEHSALGTRYVYDAAVDPVFRAVTRAAIEGRGREADLVRILADGTEETAEKSMTASGTGGTGAALTVERRLAPATDADRADGAATILGMRGDAEPVVLARLT